MQEKWASYYECLRCIYLSREGEVPLQSPFIPSVVITPRAVPSITEEWYLEIGTTVRGQEKQAWRNMLRLCGKYPHVGSLSEPSPCCIRVLRRSTCIRQVSKRHIWRWGSTNKAGGIWLLPTLTMHLQKTGSLNAFLGSITYLREAVARHCSYVKQKCI